MKTLLVLVGVRGAGKTTMLREVAAAGGRAMKPSTTRPKRGKDDEEYIFLSEDAWKSDEMLWEIKVGEYRYGMSSTELRRVPWGQAGVTVFDPGSMADFEAARKRLTSVNLVSVGLDTVTSFAKQGLRVDGDEKRKMTASEFESQRKIVNECDVVLRGDEPKVRRAIFALISLAERGGVLTRETISALLNAGALLENWNEENVQHASYDLRLGEKYACRGKVCTLSDEEPVLEIPPNGYVIVQSEERARLARTVVARFDLRVQLFLKGVLLSNGPQVDPGYSGLLFCLLYNASATVVKIRKGEHFATLEFLSTSSTAERYSGRYQTIEDFAKTMPTEALGTPVPVLADRVAALERDRTKRWTAGGMLGLAGLLVAVVTASVATQYGYVTEVRELRDEMTRLARGASELAAGRSQRHEDVGRAAPQDAGPSLGD